MPPRRSRDARPLAPFFAACAPGLEPVVAAELRALGAPGLEVEPGGVAFGGDARWMMRANLHLRAASRVVVRVARFHAEAFHELERRAAKIPWEQWAAPGAPVRFRVTCRKSRLYHSDAVAERLQRALAARLGAAPAAAARAAAAPDEDEDDAPGQLFVVRLVHDECTISVDASGALLHRRSYRQAVAKAPLRETLAAGMLLASGWTPEQPLLDPMCGSGTIAIEAALVARRIAPGLARAERGEFAFLAWPGVDRGAWDVLVAEARAAVRERAPAPIHAADRDAGAVEAARANAARAGVLEDLTIERRPLSALPALPEHGWIVTNPPYGARVGDAGPLRALYARLGALVATELDGWSLALLSADRVLEGQLRLPLVERWRGTNGGIPVRLVAYEAEVAPVV